MYLCVNTSMLVNTLVDLNMCVAGITLIPAMDAGFQVSMYRLKVYIRKYKNLSSLSLLILSALCLPERWKSVASEYSLIVMSRRRVNQMVVTFLRISWKISVSMPIATISSSIHSLRVNLTLRFLRPYGTSIGSKHFLLAHFWTIPNISLRPYPTLQSRLSF